MRGRGALIVLFLAIAFAAGSGPASADCPLPSFPLLCGPSSFPPPTPAPSGNPDDAATTFLEGPGRTDAAPAVDIAPPLALMWQRRLGSSPSYPLIAGGKAYVPIEPRALRELDLATGRTEWSASLGQTCGGLRAAYDGGRVFVQDACATVQAFDASNGHFDWRAQPAGACGAGVSGPPVATGGSVYTVGGCNGQLSALDEATGSVRWSVPNPGLACCTMSTDSVRVYLGGCYGQGAWSTSSGALIWRQTSNRCRGSFDCQDGEQQVVALGGDVTLEGELHDAATGALLRDYPAFCSPPARFGADLVVPEQRGLSAFDTGSGALLWHDSLSRPQVVGLQTPLTVDRDLFELDIGQQSSRLLAFDAASGAPRESTPLLRGTTGPVVAAEGVLLVTESDAISAYTGLFAPAGDQIGLRVSPPVVLFGPHARVRIDGRLGPALRATGPREIELQARPFGHRAFSHVRGGLSYADGGFLFNSRPRRDTLYRVVPARGVSQPIPVIAVVYPSFRFAFSFDAATRRINGSVTLRFDPGIRLPGRSAYIYEDRRDIHTLLLLGGGKLVSLGPGHADMRTSFPPPSTVTPAYVLWCVPRMSRLGVGYPDEIDRECGRRRIRYP